jgi:hypothetical protein
VRDEAYVTTDGCRKHNTHPETSGPPTMISVQRLTLVMQPCHVEVSSKRILRDIRVMMSGNIMRGQRRELEDTRVFRIGFILFSTKVSDDRISLNGEGA